MGDIRLIALDIDGTLVNDQKEVPPENLEALQEARAKGVYVAISSGRMIPSIEPIEAKLGIDTVILAYNGGKVVGPRAEGRQEILHRPVPATEAARFVDYSRERGHVLNFYHEDRLYSEEGDDSYTHFRDIYSGRTGSVYHFTDLDEFRDVSPTKLILMAHPEERDRLVDELSPDFPELFLSKSDPEYLEITARGVNKGTALPALAEYFGFSTEEILAIGDADNDNQMLEAAGLGVAVANARETTKAVADVITERTNNDGAVAEAVRRFVL